MCVSFFANVPLFAPCQTEYLVWLIILRPTPTDNKVPGTFSFPEENPKKSAFSVLSAVNIPTPEPVKKVPVPF
jgi:hypothetical protein